jgi:ABC-type transport system substrate-binding protein
VPKKYVQKVGEDGFKKAPIGAGPYRFVSFTPGVELVFEAFESYWRKLPAVKRLVFKVIPEESTRLAALKRGEVDLAYSIRGELADELRQTPGLTLKPVVIQAPFWLYFPDQWDSKSPWHDRRVREAVRLAIDYKSISEALTLGYSPITNSIIPDSFPLYWKPPPAVYDPAKAKQLLTEAGPAGGLRLQRWRLRLRQLSRHRRPVQRASGGTRPCQTNRSCGDRPRLIRDMAARKCRVPPAGRQKPGFLETVEPMLVEAPPSTEDWVMPLRAAEP